MRSTVRQLLALAAASVTGPALAQTDAMPPERMSAVTEVSSESAAASESSDVRLAQSSDSTTGAGGRAGRSDGQRAAKNMEEVVVTAQKREQALQDVPISIAVLGGESLDRSTLSVTQELERIPGFAALSSGLGGKQLSVRGVSSTGSNFAGTSTIGYYLDSVPFGFVRNAIVPDPNVFDLERVELLRGPQGTLYGVNAQNGVVRILTRDADLSKFELKGRAAGSTTRSGGENFRGDVALNAPIITDKLAVRAVVGYEEASGWIDRANAADVNDSNTTNLRLKVNAAPTERSRVGLMAWKSEVEADAREYSRQDRTTGITVEEPSRQTFDIYSLKLGYDFSAFELSSATSYIDYENETAVSFRTPATSLLYSTFNSEVFAQEVNLTSTSEGPWKWVLGGIYRDVDDFFQQRVPGVLPNPRGLSQTDASESYAIFGELTRMLFDGKFEVTGGLRYFEDSSETQQLSNAFNPNATLIYSDAKFDATSPRVVLTWHPSETLSTYASYSEGFRSGFSQSPTILALAPGFPPVDSDNLTNYEVGIKGSVAEERLGFEVATFYIDWEGVQQQVTVQSPVGPVAALINGESASGWGYDISLTARITRDFEAGVAYSWNDLSFDAPVRTLSANRPVLLADEGARLGNSPEHTASAFASYNFSLTDNFDMELAGSGSYTSGRVTRSILVPGTNATTFESDNLLIARATLSLISPDGWRAGLFAENLTDERGSVLRGAVPLEGDLRIRPRTVGLQLEYDF